MPDEVLPERPSVLSRIKAFESQSRTDSSASSSSGSSWENGWDSEKRSKLIIDDDGEHEEDWVNVPTTLTPTSLAPPLPSRKHAPASSVSSFHSVSLSSESISIDEHKDFDAASLESESYEDLNSTTSFGSPGAVARLTTDWNQKRSLPPSPPRPQSAVTTSVTKLQNPPPVPLPRAASASNARRPAPPPPDTNRISSSSSDRSSILSLTSNTSSVTSGSIHNGYPPYQQYKPKPPPPPKPSLKAPTLKISASSSSSPAPSPTSTGTITSALARKTPIPSLARKRYEAVFDANLANLNLIASSASNSSSKPALLSPSAATSLPRKGWRGLSIDLITTDDSNEKSGDANHFSQLPGPIVRVIWSKSQLSKKRLRAIWLESDPLPGGYLDREAFVRGMWRIDAELRREELERIGRAKRPADIQRRPSTASTPSSHGSLKSVPSMGSLRRTPGPAPPIPLIPPTTSMSTKSPLPAVPSPVPPPLPVRKPIMGTGIVPGMEKLDLGQDEADLLTIKIYFYYALRRCSADLGRKEGKKFIREGTELGVEYCKPPRPSAGVYTFFQLEQDQVLAAVVFVMSTNIECSDPSDYTVVIDTLKANHLERFMS
ncbi:hypothetical protein BDP27DRAFT_1365750 [Rhodocollybia butyracea]|uniref:Uncharacterized protein n=1 Tax=Rhodocollybia butyracea TaxID=206335 RepID=A0A9P5PQM2_9AGAR|nr:hypothetical protein BDP27DRAFT_1365750 [Rhodocollybia butyracea]